MKYRVCSNPECSHNGEPQPLDADHFHKRAKADGYFRKNCKTCALATQRAYREKNKRVISGKYSKYSDQDPKSGLVEDEQYKVIDVPCWNKDEGCDNVLKVLIDTKSGKRPPKKICGACKSNFDRLDDRVEHIIDKGILEDAEINESLSDETREWMVYTRKRYKHIKNSCKK
jgi:hypothetical protein